MAHHNTNQQKKQGIVSSIIEFAFLLMLVFLIRTFGFGLYQVPTGSMETTMLVGERFFADKLSYCFRTPRHGEIISMNAPDFDYSDNMLINLFQRYIWGPSNWTKRVIGIPGDVIRGVIEDGKPVVYRNGQKLDEPYINKYPLIRILRADIQDIYRELETEIQRIYPGRFISPDFIKNKVNENIFHYSTKFSYDPAVSYKDQPFYRIEADRVVGINAITGKPELEYPGTVTPSKSGMTAVEGSQNYWDGSDVFQVTLGPDEYWCMGDSRLNSGDCRYLGPFKGQQIHGRILFLIWSIDSFESWWIVDLIKHPIDFWSRMRWNRFFKLLE